MWIVWAAPVCEHRADHAVVPEAVGGMDGEDTLRRIVEERTDLSGLRPHGRPIELAGAQCQLGEPGHLVGAGHHEPDLDP